MEQIKQFLQNLSVSSPLFPNIHGKIFTVSREATVSEALKEMIDHRVLSLPLHDEPGKCVSIMQIMSHIVSLFSKDDLMSHDLYWDFGASIMARQKQIHGEKLYQVKELNELDFAPVISSEANSLDVAKLMVQNRAHRILVVQGARQLSNLITQFRIVQLLSTTVDFFPELNVSLSESRLGFKQVAAIDAGSMTVDAFLLMKEQKISAVAVVDNEGKLVGNMSAGDIKTVGFDVRFFSLLSQPVKTYLQLVHFGWTQEGEQKEPKRPFVVKCSPSDSLAYIMKLIVLYRVHRVYITDEQDRPIGVVALADILQHIVGCS
jgi:CBS domain-containing protein